MSKTFIMPSTPKDRKSIKDAISEIADHLTMIASYNEKIKDVQEMLYDDYDLNKATAKKLGTIMLKENFSETQAKHEELEELVEIIIKKPSSEAA